uniref:Pentacotripeptide-repeat region of PRORP domain-containing protein n=1 Tax=Populus trichocarpa TaxID=3694 RepID=B9H0L1_POPTR|eukprot:XP_024455704.1 pentatricopeptide repeat-containing protein At2g15980 [Populus trichocarpa]
MPPLLKRFLHHPPLPPPPPTYSLPFSTTTSPPPNHHSPLTTAIISLLTHHRSKSRWSHLRSLLTTTTSTPLAPGHFSLITLKLKSNPHLALSFFHFTLHNSSLCSHNLRSYATIIHILSRARLKAHAQEIIRAGLRSQILFNNDEDAFAEQTGLSRVEQDCEGHRGPRYHLLKEVRFFEVLVKSYRECDSAPFVFDLLIKSCLELKKIDGSIEIVKMLRSKGISPSISTCNALISEVSRCKGSFVGYGVFKEVFGLESCELGEKMRRGFRVRPNVHSFNELMVGFYRNGEVEMVEEIWSEMERFGCVANGFSYGVLIAVFCEGGRLSEAERLWDEMRVKGIMPDVVAYNTIIGGFCKAGEVEKAEGLFREMGLSGIESSCVTFEHLIEGYCRIGDVNSAILVYKDMRRRDFRLEALTMEVLIGGLCEQKRVFEALKIMRSAMRDVSFHPNGKSYELLINGLCEDGKMEEALKLQSEMVGKGFDPNSAIYGAFIEGYVKLGNEEMAAMLRKEMSVAQKQQQEDNVTD